MEGRRNDRGVVGRSHDFPAMISLQDLTTMILPMRLDRAENNGHLGAGLFTLGAPEGVSVDFWGVT